MPKTLSILPYKSSELNMIIEVEMNSPDTKAKGGDYSSRNMMPSQLMYYRVT